MNQEPITVTLTRGEARALATDPRFATRVALALLGAAPAPLAKASPPTAKKPARSRRRSSQRRGAIAPRVPTADLVALVTSAVRLGFDTGERIFGDLGRSGYTRAQIARATRHAVNSGCVVSTGKRRATRYSLPLGGNGAATSNESATGAQA